MIYPTDHKIGPNGSTTLIERGESGESHPGGGAASRAEPSDNPQSCEGDQQSLGGIMIPNSLLGFQSRSPVFRTLSRSSSGYFSFDSDSIPSSPVLKDNKSTQTPSPSSQVITHALQRMSRALETRRDYGKARTLAGVAQIKIVTHNSERWFRGMAWRT